MLVRSKNWELKISLEGRILCLTNEEVNGFQTILFPNATSVERHVTPM